MKTRGVGLSVTVFIFSLLNFLIFAAPAIQYTGAFSGASNFYYLAFGQGVGLDVTLFLLLILQAIFALIAMIGASEGNAKFSAVMVPLLSLVNMVLTFLNYVGLGTTSFPDGNGNYTYVTTSVAWGVWVLGIMLLVIFIMSLLTFATGDEIVYRHVGNPSSESSASPEEETPEPTPALDSNDLARLLDQADAYFKKGDKEGGFAALYRAVHEGAIDYRTYSQYVAYALGESNTLPRHASAQPSVRNIEEKSSYPKTPKELHREQLQNLISWGNRQEATELWQLMVSNRELSASEASSFKDQINNL